VAREETTIEFRDGNLRVDAFVRVERDEADLAPAPPTDADYEGGGPVDWAELRAPHVRSKTAFKKFLKEQAQISTTANLWCLRDVWGKLLDLLNLPPGRVPKRVKWPPS
jgi:hypothetical protein